MHKEIARTTLAIVLMISAGFVTHYVSARESARHLKVIPTQPIEKNHSVSASGQGSGELPFLTTNMGQLTILLSYANASESKQMDQPVSLTAAVDISGSVLGIKPGREAYEALQHAVTNVLRPGDRFSLLLFYDDQALTTVAHSSWGDDAERALASLLKLRLRPGDRTRFAPVLIDIAKRAHAGDVAVILTDGLISTGTPQGDKEERERTRAAAAQLAARGVKVILVPVRTDGSSPKDTEWLANLLGAKVVSADELRAGALKVFVSDLRRIDGTAATDEQPKFEDVARESRSYLAAILFICVLGLSAAFLLLRARKSRFSSEPVTSEAKPLNLKVSVADADDTDFSSEVIEVGSELSIGGSDDDTIRRDGLLPGHVRLRFSEREIKLEAYGPVRLDGDIHFEPDGHAPTVEVFPLEQEIGFSVGRTTFLVERIPPAGGRKRGKCCRRFPH